MTVSMKQEKLKRWRMILGEDAEEATGISLQGDELSIDKTLAALYDSDTQGKKGGLGKSSPNVSRWLGDIRTYFPKSIVKIMQKDALKRLNLTSLLTEPEMLEEIEADVHMVANLMSLSRVIPEKTKDTARQVVRKVVDELMRKLTAPMQQAISGSINRAIKNKRPRHNEIDWNATIRKNLKHYQKEYKTIIPESRVGFGRRRSSLKDIVLCIDQSASMGTSVVYSGIYGAVLASIPAVKTSMVVFDTSVADLTEELQDPVELLFGVQLGGGTNINKALGYCKQLIHRPSDSVLVVVTDLYEGGNQAEMRKKFAGLVAAGVCVVVLLALSDDGSPSYDRNNAGYLAEIGVPVFSCTPDLFPDLMAAAIQNRDLGEWQSANEAGLS